MRHQQRKPKPIMEEKFDIIITPKEKISSDKTKEIIKKEVDPIKN